MVQKFCIAALVALLLAPIAQGQARKGRQPARSSQKRETTVAAAASSALSLPPEKSQRLRAQAEEVGQAFERKDFNRMAELTYPKLVEILGGRARMVAFLERGVRELEAEGSAILSTTIGEPLEVISVGKEFYAIVPTVIKIRVKGGVGVGQSYMIGVSADGGENWTFVSAAGDLDKEKLKVLFPAAIDKLHLPERKLPVFYPAENSAPSSEL